MVSLHRFNLKSLKEMYTELKYLGYFYNIKTYQLCKYDLISLLRNTKLFDEEDDDYLLFYHPEDKKWNKLIPKRRYYDRGEKILTMKKISKEIILKFD